MHPESSQADHQSREDLGARGAACPFPIAFEVAPHDLGLYFRLQAQRRLILQHSERQKELGVPCPAVAERVITQFVEIAEGRFQGEVRVAQ